MKIKCINNKEVEGQLKLNIEYTTIGENETSYIIQLGNGVKGTYLKSRFEKVE
jgi:hypothetical protein